MPRHSTLLAASALSVALFASGCGGDGADSPTGQASMTGAAPTTSASSQATPTEAPADDQDATAVAEQIKQPTTTKIVTVTEDNDPNDMIGRPNGYVTAAVLYDSAATCTELGIECGATVEVWPDDAAAKARSDYIQVILKDAPVLGSEFHTINGPVLLRVDGKQLKPSAAKPYAEALTQ